MAREPAVAGAAPAHAIQRAEDVRETGYAIAVLGGTRRVGRWTPARVNHAMAFCGGVEIDFREAVMPPGVTELKVFAMWGGVEVIVPPGMNVECHGVGVMGGFDHAAEDAARDPTAPTLRVAGIVEIRPWILSWGDSVQVLDPPELREVVAGAMRRAAARYEA